MQIETVSKEDLVYAVGRLIASGKLKPQELAKLTSEREQRIASLRAELESLTRGQASAGDTAKREPERKGPHRHFTMTAKMQAARKLQGRYLGLLKTIDGRSRARIQAIAREKGVAQAVKAARAAA